MANYNYDAFSPDDYDFKNSAGPEVGEIAQDFELTTIEGNSKRLLDFSGDFLILELGSITCPLFLTRHDSMHNLKSDYPDLDFSVLYVREAHPGSEIPGHTTLDEKISCASRLTNETIENRLVLVDDLDGSAHQAYGSLPNAIFIIDQQKKVRFKAEWNNPSATRTALESLLKGEQVNVKSYFQPAKPSIVLSTVARAGKGSKSDFFQGLPMLIWNNLIKLNIKTFFK